MRRVAVALLIAGLLTMGGVKALTMPAQAQVDTDPSVVLDKTFTLDPNDQSGMDSDCINVPYGVLLTVVVSTPDEDIGGERVNFVFKEGDRTRLRTTLTDNPTVATAYAGAGTYCYTVAASHVHLDVVAPIRHARLTITADSDMSHFPQ